MVVSYAAVLRMLRKLWAQLTQQHWSWLTQWAQGQYKWEQELEVYSTQNHVLVVMQAFLYKFFLTDWLLELLNFIFI